MPKGNTKPLLRALGGEALTPPPWWLMRQAGRYLPEYRAIRARAQDFVEMCLTPTVAAELTLQPVRRYHMDAAILFSDILMLPHALGQKLTFREGEGPILEPIESHADFRRLKPGQTTVASRAGLRRSSPRCRGTRPLHFVDWFCGLTVDRRHLHG